MKYSFISEDSDENTRLDNYLSEQLLSSVEKISRAKIQSLIKNAKVLVNGQVKKPSLKLKEGDKIEIEIDELKENVIVPQNIPLDIVYEDENMLVVNKPSGMLTHPTSIEREGTLVNALLFKYGQNLSDINGYLRRGILHRLDRNTSGLLMVAKNNKTHEFLANQIKEKTVVKKYLAVVKGVVRDDSGVINLPVGRHLKQPQKMAVVREEEGGKPSITEFRVLKRFKEHTYLELDLKTGRTHQIRVHLSHLRHPILNDTLYGAGQFKVKTQDQVLQSYKLTFIRPFAKTSSSDIIELEIEPDEKIKKVLKYLEIRG